MNLESIKNAAKFAAHRGVLQTRKHSPAILMTAGIVGMIGTAVLSSRATLKLESVVDKMDGDLVTAKALRVGQIEDGLSAYSEEDFNRDRTIIYARGVVDITKLYLPAAALGVVSIGAIVGGHTILNRRNVALAAAYTALEKGFNKYRDRVVEAIGADKEQELRHAIVKKEEKDHETGETAETFHIDPNGLSVYARFFDETNKNWVKQPEYNLLFLRSQQNYANDLLKARGHVFLNEVYDMLGLERTQAGQVVGWTLGSGDNFVDFGIYDRDNEKAREFVNGLERAILLDFNVDGLIFDKI